LTIRVSIAWLVRILLRDGAPLAALNAGTILNMNDQSDSLNIESALKIGKLLVALRRYSH
jgi:hypothetical protein